MLRLIKEELLAEISNDIKNFPAGMLEVFKSRSENNPADFDTNITSLRGLETLYKPMVKKMKVFINNTIENSTEDEGKFDLNIDQEIKAAFQDNPEITVKMKQTFSNEPRIIGILYNTNWNVKETQIHPFFKNQPTKMTCEVFKDKTKVNTYTIEFCDHTKLTLHSLDAETLNHAKIVFDKKMEALALTSQNNKEVADAIQLKM